MKSAKWAWFVALLLTGLLVTATAQAPEIVGLVVVQSPHSVDETLANLEEALADNGLTVVATINHDRNAASADLELPPTRLVIFGNPQAGTPLMQEQRTVGIDLPQKMLIWEEGGSTYVGYNDPVYLAERHGLDAQGEAITMVGAALANLAGAAAAP